LRRHTTARQRGIALLLVATCLGGAAWYVATVAANDGRSYTGVVLSNGVIDLNFALAGRVAQISVQAGQQVKAGQVLATETSATTMAVVAADQAAIAADKAALTQISDQAAPGAAALAAAQARLASDRARLAVEQVQVVGMQIQAPASGTVIAVNGQVGETVTAASVRENAAQSQETSTSQQSALSLLGSQTTAATGMSMPLIALRTSTNWQVDMVIPENSSMAVRRGEAVTIAVPAANLSGVHGRIEELLPTPVRTAQGVDYQALVTVPGYQPAPPFNGMAAELRLGP
jgi:multidrug efflux pump subunit AcrA (membrane-fusion protein)